MLGSIDCMRWEWKKYPKALHGQFKRRDHKYLTLMLKSVLSMICRFDMHFGVLRANNDLNVLYASWLFDDLRADIALEAPFLVNVNTCARGYYLADGIYTQWFTFVKSFYIARDEKIAKFKRV